jgi:hypothetical protein
MPTNQPPPTGQMLRARRSGHSHRHQNFSTNGNGSAYNFSASTFTFAVLQTLQSFDMADNEDDLVDYDEEEVRSNNRQQQESL